LDQQGWKRTASGVATRADVANHFVQCLRLIDSERFEAARLSLTPPKWRGAADDLSPVPADVLDRTERLCTRSRGLLPYGDPDVIRAIMLEILDIWS
jgi:hypothetical protein